MMVIEEVTKMLYIEIGIAIYLIVSYIHFQLSKRKNNYRTTLLTGQIDTSNQFKKTLAMGLYLRFRNEDSSSTIKENPIFIKEDRYLFEHFVADIYKAVRGGSIWVTPRSGDFGVDFEHETEDGKFLGQVKCEMNNMDFEPIAVLHSNMIKNGAMGGYVITTSSFTEAAKHYARGLDIELIDGVRLVELWLDGMENTEEEIKHFIPEFEG